MKKNQFLDELKIIFEVKKIDQNLKLEDLYFDSLKLLELIAFKEAKFKKLKIKPSDFENCKKISDLVKLFKIK